MRRAASCCGRPSSASPRLGEVLRRGATGLGWHGLSWASAAANSGVRGRVMAFDALTGPRAVALQYHSDGQGDRRGDLAAPGDGQDRWRRRLGRDDAGRLGRRAVRAGRQSLAGHRQGLPPGREPVHRLDRRARCAHRRAQVVAPGHARGLDGPRHGRAAGALSRATVRGTTWCSAARTATSPPSIATRTSSCSACR